MKSSKILIVDDEPDFLDACRDSLMKLRNVDVDIEAKSARVVERLEKGETWDILMIDLMMPELSGIELLKKVRALAPHAVVCMITGYPTIETAVEAVKLGAFDYLTKPFSPSQAQMVVQRAIEQKHLREENLLLQRHVEKPYKFDDIIGQSPAIQRIFDLIRQVAETPSDVLIVGESGTGKELIARSIHARSRARKGRFVPVDCGAIPENILESELFGHERGAFTGAVASQIGLLEYAQDGTFFLDEICELPALLQSKLLRALQERTFRRVGGQEEIRVNVRVIAATNRDIEAEVREKRFREDLYYRINVLRIDVPPLRKRKEDIELLSRYFLERCSREFGRSVKGIDPEAMEILSQYSWPGNVRELQNIVKRTILLAKGDVIGTAELPDGVVAGAGEGSADSWASLAGVGYFHLRARKLAAFEEEYLRDLMIRSSGDVAQAAVEARIPRGTLYRLLSKYGLKSGAFRQ